VVLDLTSLSEACGNGSQAIDEEALTEGASFPLMNKGHGLGTEDSLDQNMDLVEYVKRV